MKSLAVILRDRILPMFRDVPQEFHPWWWPSRTGANQVDYFSENLTKDEIERATGMPIGQVMDSIQWGSFSPSKATDLRYREFMGIWGEMSGDVQVVFVSDRPSRDAYPSGVTTRLMNLLGRLDLVGAHFTDFIKRRGEASSSDLPPGDTLIRHGNILVEEISCIASSGTSRLCLIPVQARTLKWLTEQSIAGRLEQRLNGTKVILPQTYAIFWARRGLTDQEAYENWSRILKQCTSQ